MWLKKNQRYAYYKDGCVTYFEAGVCGMPQSGFTVTKLLTEGWGFATGIVPLMYINKVKG